MSRRSGARARVLRKVLNAGGNRAPSAWRGKRARFSNFSTSKNSGKKAKHSSKEEFTNHSSHGNTSMPTIWRFYVFTLLISHLMTTNSFIVWRYPITSTLKLPDNIAVFRKLILMWYHWMNTFTTGMFRFQNQNWMMVLHFHWFSQRNRNSYLDIFYL